LNVGTASRSPSGLAIAAATTACQQKARGGGAQSGSAHARQKRPSGHGVLQDFVNISHEFYS